MNWPDTFPLFPETASEMARRVDGIYFFGLAIAAFFSLLIAVVIFYLAVRYRRRHPDEVGQPEKAAVWLEVLWSVIPFVILMVMFAWGAQVFVEARRVPKGAVEYWATAKQWMWKFQHPDGTREINELHVPVNTPIKLIMTSEDVIHDLWVPAFRVKMDVLPGRYTTMWFEADKPGTYRLFCNEYCGVEHSLMGGQVVVMEPTDYEAWLGGGLDLAPRRATGEELFAEKVCNTCHKVGSGALGPNLAGVFGSEVELEDGSVVVADENYIRQSILEPGSQIVKGYKNLMPTYKGQIDEEELVELILYIKGLAGPTATAAAGSAAAGSEPSP